MIIDLIRALKKIWKIFSSLVRFRYICRRSSPVKTFRFLVYTRVTMRLTGGWIYGQQDGRLDPALSVSESAPVLAGVYSHHTDQLEGAVLLHLGTLHKILLLLRGGELEGAPGLPNPFTYY